jgi:hypothetical protein
MLYLHPDWQATVRVRTAVVIKMATIGNNNNNNNNIKILQ